MARVASSKASELSLLPDDTIRYAAAAMTATNRGNSQRRCVLVTAFLTCSADWNLFDGWRLRHLAAMWEYHFPATSEMMIPSEYMSLRASRVCPFNCSGEA